MKISRGGKRPGGKLPGGKVPVTVPKLSSNLVSIAQISSDRKSVEFFTDSCKILDQKKKMIAHGKRIGNLYLLD